MEKKAVSLEKDRISLEQLVGEKDESGARKQTTNVRCVDALTPLVRFEAAEALRTLEGFLGDKEFALNEALTEREEVRIRRLKPADVLTC